MLKKVCRTLLCLAVSYNVTTSYAMGSNAHRYSGFTFKYEFQPNQSQFVSNPLFATMTAVCKITTDQKNELQALGVARKGKINDIPLSAGQMLSLTVQSNDDIKLTAEPGAKVQITNVGKSVVYASCVL